MPDRDFNPKDGGFIRIMNEFADAMRTYRLSPTESAVVWHIIRQTWGMKGKAWAPIHWTEFMDKCRIARGSVYNSINRLLDRNFIQTKQAGDKTHYKINSKPSTWKIPEPGKPRFQERGIKFQERGIKFQERGIKDDSTFIGKDNIKDSIKDKKPAALKIMDEEVLQHASIRKVIADTDLLCLKLTEEGIFPKAHAFRNAMMKQNKNERAILHALSRTYLKKEFDKGPWQYALKIIKVENGNYNERDFHKTT